ncbi:S-adenosylmethionine:tRNA ribosyltransferase-isomerase [Lacunisphaera limnophila]|uniref:S-adenosylmethionine:tRNA ribosyltransferase-isomerase n=1 Tax=Lacunisphaera limnophila TaxID=1838286 RepID=A0A1D8AQZ0_9BACT|nr:tRNA preQ1(34) S-adenosylmethionine ribosyltransferase-isomerase QueA [Lacunisphaera limnophila]AOS43074.1 S-adenosylmethionine:tRNA ribosyltransferase-isomerase [Lacunisphaera limnophila]
MSPLSTDLFDYPLPERLIAQSPAQQRDASRLLVVDRSTRTLAHRHFRDLPDYLRAGDTLFRNNAAVIPARLHATRPTGGQVECLLLRPAVDTAGLPAVLSAIGPATAEATQSPSRMESPPSPSLRRTASALTSLGEGWWCLLRPGKKLPVGATFGLAGAFTATVLEKTDDGLARVAFTTTGGDLLAVANRIGDMPLPPYISGHENAADRTTDRERYQTVYADRGHQVAAAAPTAGLHFTPELLTRIAGQGVTFADLTLHVGLGTFRPIMTDTIQDHAIHREVYEIPVATQQALFAGQGRRIAVGTTSVRSIEDYLSRTTSAMPQDWMAEAGIFIYPPRPFRGVDALITNFHQPRSTLLCLVSAFLTPGSTEGIAWLKDIYAEAVAEEYRFFSYGDAMLIL